MNYQTVCRICIGENSGMLSIFQYYKFSEHHHEIFKVIADCARVQIEELDGFSEQICGKCLARLSEAYSFKRLCEESDYKFRNNLIESNETKIKKFFEEEPKIQYNEMQDAENADNSKVACNESTQIKTEEFYEEIKTEALSDDDEDVIQEIEGEFGTTRLSCVAYDDTECGEPFISKDYTENEPSSNSELDYKMESDSIINENEIKSEISEERINCVDIRKITETRDFGLTEIRKENKQPDLILPKPAITPTNTTPTSGNWGYEDTKFLLNRYKCYMWEVGLTKRFKMKKQMWQQISIDLLNIGSNRTAIQVENRCETLLKQKKGLLKMEEPNFARELSKIASMETSIASTEKAPKSKPTLKTKKIFVNLRKTLMKQTYKKTFKHIKVPIQPVADGTRKSLNF